MFPEFNRLFIQKALEDIIGELDLFSKTREQSDKFLEEEWPKLEQGVERKGPYGDRPDVARSEMAGWRRTFRDREESDEALEAWFDPRNKEMTQEALDVLHKAKKDAEEEAALEEDLTPFKRLYQQGRESGLIDDISDDDWWESNDAPPNWYAEELKDWDKYYGEDHSKEIKNIAQEDATNKLKWEFIDNILEENPERDPSKPIFLGQDDPDGEMEKVVKQLAKEEGQGWILKAITSGRIPATVALALIGTLWSKPAY
jgi:hypothetical protein|tara:strand:+ start:16 stop:789 length:774 start_codon:yes stop_codon:yes gene_type:complete